MMVNMVKTARHHRTTCIIARVQGRIVVGGVMEIAAEICGLFGLSVNPEHRRRGIQQSLIAARLNVARPRGCRVATISGKPGEGTERNVRRMSFQVAYTKATLTKPGPVLTPMWARPAPVAGRLEGVGGVCLWSGRRGPPSAHSPCRRRCHGPPEVVRSQRVHPPRPR